MDQLRPAPKFIGVSVAPVQRAFPSVLAARRGAIAVVVLKHVHYLAGLLAESASRLVSRPIGYHLGDAGIPPQFFLGAPVSFPDQPDQESQMRRGAWIMWTVPPPQRCSSLERVTP